MVQLIPNNFKLSEKDICDVLDILEYTAVILPHFESDLIKAKKGLKLKYCSSQANSVKSRQEIEALQTLVLLEIINLEILSENILCEKWFGRLIVNVLFQFKFGYVKMPIEVIEKIVDEITKIKKKLPRFYEVRLNHFLVYEYGSMLYPYPIERLHIDDFHRNLRRVPFSILKKFDPGKKVFVIIPFYVSGDEKFSFRQQTLEENLRRVFQQAYSNIEIYLVVNNANKEKKWIDDLRSKCNVKGAMVSENNLGSARAKNECIRLLMRQKDPSDYVLFLDDDTYLNDNYCISKLVYLFETFPNTFGCVSPQIVHGSPANGAILRDGYEPPWEFSVFKDFHQFAEEQLRNTDLWRESFLVEGSCMMVPTNVLRKTKLFPEEYNYYHEETLMEYKIKLEQGKINAVIQNSYVTHQRIGGGGTSTHAMYYLYRNFGYLLYDTGVRQKSKKLYDLIIKQFNSYCEFLISGEELTKQIKLRQRLALAKKHLKEFERSGVRVKHIREFDPTGTLSLLKKINDH